MGWGIGVAAMALIGRGRGACLPHPHGIIEHERHLDGSRHTPVRRLDRMG